jgi:hypothetical protein
MDKVLHDAVHIQRATPRPNAPSHRGKPAPLAYVYERLFRSNTVWSERDKGMRHKSFSIVINIDLFNEFASSGELRVWDRDNDKWTTIHTLHRNQLLSPEQFEEIPSHLIRPFHFSADTDELTTIAQKICSVDFDAEVWERIKNPMAGIFRDARNGGWSLENKPVTIVMKGTGDEFTGTIDTKGDDEFSWIRGYRFDMLVRKEDEKILDEPVSKSFDFREIHHVVVL